MIQIRLAIYWWQTILTFRLGLHLLNKYRETFSQHSVQSRQCVLDQRRLGDRDPVSERRNRAGVAQPSLHGLRRALEVLRRRSRLCLRLRRRPVVKRRRPHSELCKKRQKLCRCWRRKTTKSVQEKDVFGIGASQLSDQESSIFARNQSCWRSPSSIKYSNSETHFTANHRLMRLTQLKIIPQLLDLGKKNNLRALI